MVMLHVLCNYYPQCFAMRHAEALNEVQIARKCEASLSHVAEIGHESLRKVAQEEGDIVFKLKSLHAVPRIVLLRL